MAPIANVSLTRKVNLGNYESVDLHAEIVGVSEGMSAQDLDGLMDTIHLTWSVLAAAIDRQRGAASPSPALSPNLPHPTSSTDPQPQLCSDCGEPLTDTHFKDGTVWTPAQLAAYGIRKHGRTLCMSHYREANDIVRRSSQLNSEEIPF